MRYLILALTLMTAIPAYAAELPNLMNQPLATPGSSNADYVRDQSFRDTMEKSESKQDTIYVPVERQEQPSMLNQGGLQRGW